MKKSPGLFFQAAVLSLCLPGFATAADAPAAPKLKDEMRQPWQRTNEDYLRHWLVLGPIHCDLVSDCLKSAGGEAAVKPEEGAEVKLSDGAALKWGAQGDYNDSISFDGFTRKRAGGVGYAAVNIPRDKAGKALLSVGSSDGIRVWVNGKRVLAKDGHRSLTPDEDQIEVDLNAGDNSLVVKVAADATFIARVLEAGAVTTRLNEIGPSLIEIQPDIFTVRTDADSKRAGAEPVKVEVIRPGGAVVFSGAGKRGELVLVPCKTWPDGPYEVRLTTSKPTGLLYVTHLAFYKGNALVKARELAAEAARADASKPEGFTLKMLAEMVDDRLGVKLADATGNPWPGIHSPLMEFDELMLERRGEVGRVRPSGFVRLAWTDEVDGSPQYCRAYLPASYDKSKPWPLVLHLHGYNPANPVYWRWWSADSRHPSIDTEFSHHQQVIYIDPHGRNNVQYKGIGDSDIMRCLAEAKRAFSVDENRVYLSGESMGGWGTWNVATRHPDVFAAIAPIFGGVDYHAAQTEEDLARLSPIDRFLDERESSWAQAEGLLNVPILVQHGDADGAVNVDWSRWGVKLLQRWGYDVRYREYPGRIHETLQHSNSGMSIDWFLQHVRNPDPRHVRLRSAELRHAKAYWVEVLQPGSPLEFMRVDAEVVDRNVIRLDTDNVLDVSLSPTKDLVDPAEPVKVVWNGVAQDLTLQGGSLRLTSAAYKPATLRKTAQLPGGSDDFFVTPFAVVIGTTAKDPAMKELCQVKAQAFMDSWRDAQKQPVRVFKDTEITAADIAKYSLILMGGADANLVTAKLARQLPLRVTRDAVTIDGRQIRAKDSVVQLLYPNPRNHERYVWVIAGQSANGLYNADLDLYRQYEWDYLVSDGLIPAAKAHVSPLALRVTQGMFDYDWKYSAALEVPGDARARAQGRPIPRPDANIRFAPGLLETYTGKYQIDRGPVIEILKKGGQLSAIVAGDEAELVPTGQASFLVPRFNVRLDFVRDAAGKVTGVTGYGGNDFEGKKLD
ncbi:MAG: prolyl oligopeptidase family serine peptidase [Pseudomonadota bacterium]